MSKQAVQSKKEECNEVLSHFGADRTGPAKVFSQSRADDGFHGFPLVQLIVLGYAFGGKITGATIAFVDNDHSVESRRVREMFAGIEAGPKTFRVVDYDSVPQAVDDLKAGFVQGVLEVPQNFSENFYQHNRPKIGFTEDNTDQVMAGALLERVQQMVNDLNAPNVAPRLDAQVQLNVVEVYPYIEYAKYLLAGSTAMAIFIVAMIGGGITFIDDKSRGLHEGYLLTPIHKTELVLGLIGAGAFKGLLAGMALTLIGGLLVGIPGLLEPGAPFISDLRCSHRVASHDQLHVSGHGARGRSARAARDFRRAQHAAVFSIRRDFSDPGISPLAARAFGH